MTTQETLTSIDSVGQFLHPSSQLFCHGDMELFLSIIAVNIANFCFRWNCDPTGVFDLSEQDAQTEAWL